MLVAVPLGVGAAAYLSEIAPPRVRRRQLVPARTARRDPERDLRVLGDRVPRPRAGWPRPTTFFGLKNQSGEGIVAAGLVLAVMILPYITALSFDVCQAVPRSQREGSLALGATRWQTIWKVVLPYARPGIIAACFLALGRAVGETMAVTMVIGNAQHLDFSPTATGDSIPSIIAKQLHETGPADADKRAVLIALGLLLLVDHAGDERRGAVAGAVGVEAAGAGRAAGRGGRRPAAAAGAARRRGLEARPPPRPPAPIA